VPAGLGPGPRVEAGAAEAVLGQIFQKYLKDVGQCPDGALTAEQARAQGKVAPRVKSAIAGAFVEPGAAEQVLDISVGECGATHADGWGSHRLVLLRDGKVQANLDLAGKLTGAADIDGDGRKELLIESGGTGQGITTVTLKIARITGAALAVLREIPVYEGGCGARNPEGEETTRVFVVARGGGAVDFDLLRERRDCAK